MQPKEDDGEIGEDETEYLERTLMRLQMRSALLELDLQQTQLMMLRMLKMIAPLEADHWKDCFVERRHELIERVLIRWEGADPQLTAEIQDEFYDDFEDWLTPNPDGD